MSSLSFLGRSGTYSVAQAILEFAVNFVKWDRIFALVRICRSDRFLNHLELLFRSISYI